MYYRDSFIIQTHVCRENGMRLGSLTYCRDCPESGEIRFVTNQNSRPGTECSLQLRENLPGLNVASAVCHGIYNDVRIWTKLFQPNLKKTAQNTTQNI